MLLSQSVLFQIFGFSRYIQTPGKKGNQQYATQKIKIVTICKFTKVTKKRNDLPCNDLYVPTVYGLMGTIGYLAVREIPK